MIAWNMKQHWKINKFSEDIDLWNNFKKFYMEKEKHNCFFFYDKFLNAGTTFNDSSS